MSTKEATRLPVLTHIVQGTLQVTEAAVLLDLSERQLYRILKRYRVEGAQGLVHRGRGQPSNHRYPPGMKDRVISLYWSSYRDYGPTQFAEQLAASHGMDLHPETVRRWLNEHGGATVQRKKRPHRRKRERRSAIGALVQFDGSEHDWLEGRGRRCCLLHIIDDASGRVFLRLVNSENTKDVLATLKAYIQRYGIPHAIYVDRGSVFYALHKRTDFQRAMHELGVKVIFANSPQAKGRVERGNRTHQDRLIKALRREKISTIDQANVFLDRVYLDEHNRRFAQIEGLPDVHVPADGCDLDRMFSLQIERQVRNDCTISLAGTFVQLERGPEALPPPKHSVTVCTYLDGSLHIFWQDRELAWTRLSGKPPRRKPVVHPKDSHPWRKAPPIGRARHYSIPELCRKK